MRRSQYAIRKNIIAKENIKIKMNKKCILCGAEFTKSWQIVFHECDRESDEINIQETE